ncbi:MAG: hypothetical protein M3R04_05130 [bacterium]|nr:hypothetical protein [bacterium]
MRLICCLALLCCLFAASLARAQAPVEVPVLTPAWADDTTFEFGIYEKDERVASAYYRILKEKSMDRDVYRFKYVGRNPRISEATECVVDARTLRPLRSTRKVVYDGKTFFQDSGYREGGVLLRKRYEGKEVVEKPVVARGELYDYEELLWLIPQLNIPDKGKARFELFSMLSEAVTTVIITQAGYEDVNVHGKSYPARLYTFDVGITPYKYWMVMQSGKPIPARIEMAGTRFENLKLDKKKVTKFPKYEVVAITVDPSEDDGQGLPESEDDEITPFLPPPSGS